MYLITYLNGTSNLLVKQEIEESLTRAIDKAVYSHDSFRVNISSWDGGKWVLQMERTAPHRSPEGLRNGRNVPSYLRFANGEAGCAAMSPPRLPEPIDDPYDGVPADTVLTDADRAFFKKCEDANDEAAGRAGNWIPHRR